MGRRAVGIRRHADDEVSVTWQALLLGQRRGRWLRRGMPMVHLEPGGLSIRVRTDCVLGALDWALLGGRRLYFERKLTFSASGATNQTGRRLLALLRSLPPLPGFVWPPPKRSGCLNAP